MDYNPCISRCLYVPEIGEIAANLLTIAASFHGQPRLYTAVYQFSADKLTKAMWNMIQFIPKKKDRSTVPFVSMEERRLQFFVGCRKVEGSGNLTFELNLLCNKSSTNPDWCSNLVFSVVEVSQTILRLWNKFQAIHTWYLTKNYCKMVG